MIRPAPSIGNLIHPSERASVLVGVLWVQVLLTVIVVSLLYTTRLELRISKTHSDSIRAYYLAVAGSEKARHILDLALNDRQSTGVNHKDDVYKEVNEFRPTSLGTGTFQIGYPANVAGLTNFVFGVLDEERFLNINVATIEEIKKLPGFDVDLAPYLIDFRDEDSEVTQGGYEIVDESASTIAGGESDAYSPKNQALVSRLEILAIPVVNAALMYGEDSDLDGALDSHEDDGGLGMPMDNRDGQLLTGWVHSTTVNSGISTDDARGQKRINIQEAAESQWTGINGVTEEMAGQIVRWRNNNSLESLVDLLQVRSGGDNNNGEGGNNNNESEDSNSGNNVISQDFLISIGDSITTGEAKVGCVNINSASKEVLTCLDGLEGELAEAIINHRSSSGYFKNILEILNVAGMTVEKFRAIENRICVRSETYRIYSEGLVPASNISRRLETIVQINSSGIKNIAQRIVD